VTPMADPKKEPMIGKSSRPTAIDYDAPVSGMKLGELIAHLASHGVSREHLKPEVYKPEYHKPEFYKPDYYKPEYYKPDFAKEYKETVKEKEFTGPVGDPVEELATRVAEILKNRK
jgi:hypothetical protein